MQLPMPAASHAPASTADRPCLTHAQAPLVPADGALGAQGAEAASWEDLQASTGVCCCVLLFSRPASAGCSRDLQVQHHHLCSLTRWVRWHVLRAMES